MIPQSNHWTGLKQCSLMNYRRQLRIQLCSVKTMTISVKNIQDQVKVVGFYHPFHTRPILTPGIRICSQKWSQVNISIGYRYISQVKLLYKVKFSKLEICQSDCRFKILAKNCQKKVSFFFWNFEWNIVKIDFID